jgi:hypothetical protein
MIPTAQRGGPEFGENFAWGTQNDSFPGAPENLETKERK